MVSMSFYRILSCGNGIYIFLQDLELWLLFLCLFAGFRVVAAP